MRLPLIAPADLTDAQRPLYEDMHAGIEKGFRGFITERQDGALMGPWNPWLHEPEIGRAVWDLTKALSARSTLPDPCRQIAILVTGAHFRAGYEIYAHVAVAQKDGLSDSTIATIVAGQRPADLPADQAIAYDTAAALVGGGVLPALNYRIAADMFGAHGVAELIYLVGLYCMVSVTLNGFDVPVPESPDKA
jgi:4-carboxymuconolactone decarboxylase